MEKDKAYLTREDRAMTLDWKGILDEYLLEEPVRTSTLTLAMILGLKELSKRMDIVQSEVIPVFKENLNGS